MPRKVIRHGVSVAPAAPAWTPASLSVLSAWYDASDAGSITESSGSVSPWDDLSGNGFHLTQGTGGNQPTTGTRTINSLNVIDFDGSTDFLHASSVAVTQPFTVYCVMLWDVVGVGNRYFDAADGIDGGRALLYNNSGMVLQAGAAANSSRSPSTATAYQHVAVFNDTSSAFYENGTQYGGALSPGTGGCPAINISSDSAGGGFFDGVVGEFVVQSGAASAGDVGDWSAYTLAKWGV